jgi:hypothetical protein
MILYNTVLTFGKSLETFYLNPDPHSSKVLYKDLDPSYSPKGLDLKTDPHILNAAPNMEPHTVNVQSTVVCAGS